jgi:DNA damage-binding protein 1
MLERTGNWHLGDYVTKFIRGIGSIYFMFRLYELKSLFPGSLSQDVEENTQFVANELFFTSSGRIGVLLDITDSKLPMQLTALERNMAYVVEGIGGESHTR